MNADYNMAEIVAGVPGSGKSSYQAQRLAGMTQSIRLVHDPAIWWAKKTGTFARGLAELHASVTKAPGKIQAWIPARGDADFLRSIVPEEGDDIPEDGDPSALIHYGQWLAAAIKRRYPVVMAFDEAVRLRNMSPSYIDPYILDAIMLRRHTMCGYSFGTQRFQILHPALLDVVTEVVCLRMSPRQVRRLGETYDVPSDLQTKISEQSPLQYTTLKVN